MSHKTPVNKCSLSNKELTKGKYICPKYVNEFNVANF